jgi:Lon protease-like protein
VRNAIICNRFDTTSFGQDSEFFHYVTTKTGFAGTVLLPDGLLPLKIFEQRYLDMTKTCLRDNQPFGVCLIREGHERLAHERVGCLATIEQWETPVAGMFHLLVRGAERFRIVETTVAPNALISGEIEIMPPVAPRLPDAECAALLKRVIEQVGAESFPGPIRLDDSVWVAYRLAEILNLPMAFKQGVLEAVGVGKVFQFVKNNLGTST